MEAVADRVAPRPVDGGSERPVYAFLASKVRKRQRRQTFPQRPSFWHTGDLTRMTEAVPFLPWVMTIAYNCLVDHWRKSSREGGDLPDERILAAPEQTGMIVETHEIVEAMTQISPEDSALLTMFYAEECGSSHDRRTTRCSQGTAKVRLFRAEPH